MHNFLLNYLFYRRNGCIVASQQSRAAFRKVNINLYLSYMVRKRPYIFYVRTVSAGILWGTQTIYCFSAFRFPCVCVLHILWSRRDETSRAVKHCNSAIFMPRLVGCLANVRHTWQLHSTTMCFQHRGNIMLNSMFFGVRGSFWCTIATHPARNGGL